VRRTTILLTASFLLASATLANAGTSPRTLAEEVGSVHFLTRVRKRASFGFNRAVALLHSFQYEQARQAFPTKLPCWTLPAPMAQWGVPCRTTTVCGGTAIPPQAG